VFWGTQIDENGALGPIRDQVGIQAPKKTKKVSGFGLDLRPFWLHFRTFPLVFGSYFFAFFLKAAFSFSGCFWPPKVSKRLPKWSQNEGKMEPAGTL